MYIDDNIDFVDIFMESMLVIESNLNQIKINTMINEYSCLENHNFNGLVLLNEGVISNTKNTIIKLFNSIVKMWNIFVHKVEEIFKLEKKFLEDNKDVILKKKPIKAEISIYEYNHNAIANTTITRYDTKTILNFDQKKALSDLKLNTSDKKISEVAKILFRGDSVKTKLSTEINFAEMYNYCISFKKLKDNIRNDLKQLENTKESILISANVEAKKIQENKPKANNESVYCNFLESYITEVNINSKINTNASTTNSNSDNKTDTTIGANIKNIKGNEPDEKEVKKMVNTSDVLGEEYKELEKRIKDYYDFGGQILAAKLNVSMEAFKDYMKILRWHVDNFTDKEKLDTDRKNVQTSTNYNEVEQETPL